MSDSFFLALKMLYNIRGDRMNEFRTKKLLEAIEVQSRLKRKEALALAEEINLNTDWESEFDYAKVVNNYLREQGLLRNQVQKSCKIREGTRLNRE